MIKKYINGKTEEFRLILQGDFGKDPDDVFALLNGVKSIDCVIANLFESKLRARLAKSILRDLSMPHIPVYAGSNVGEDIITIADFEFDYPNLVTEDEIIIDKNPYLSILSDGIESVLIINSAMTDLAKFLTKNYDPKIHKIHLIIMQGGYEIGPDNNIIPNSSANNAYDLVAAQLCFDFIQKHELPFVIITKQLAYDNSIPADSYSQLSSQFELNPVTKYLENVRLKSIQELYKLTILEDFDPKRQGLPKDRNVEWFFKNIAQKPTPQSLPYPSEIGQYITHLVVYDVFTVLYSIQNQEHQKFDLVKLNNNFFEAIAKPEVKYSDWIITNSKLVLNKN